MKSENKCLPYLTLDGDQYIFVGAFKDPVRKGYLKEKDVEKENFIQVMLPIKSILNERYLINDEGIIEERYPLLQSL